MSDNTTDPPGLRTIGYLLLGAGFLLAFWKPTPAFVAFLFGACLIADTKKTSDPAP